MKLRFVHEHKRDPAEVEALVEFALAPLRIPYLVAVKLREPTTAVCPNGAAMGEEHRKPRWAGRARHAIRLGLPDENGAGTQYGEPRVCYHAAAMRWTQDEVDHATEAQVIRRRRAQLLDAIERGETKLGRWPIYTVHTWREALVHLAAHEGQHVAQFLGGRPISEVRCEEYAIRRLDEWRAR